MKWDCYLPQGAVDCAELRSSLTSQIPFLKTTPDRQSADVTVTITSVPAEAGVRYVLDFAGKRGDGYPTEVHTTDRIPSTIDSVTATVRLLTKLQRGLDDFMDQKIAAGMEDGVLTLKLSDPARLPFTGRPEQHGINWYASPSVGGYFSDFEGVGINASGNASVVFNYSGRAFRTQQSLTVNYAQQSQPVAGTGETASIHFAGGNAMNVLAHSLGEGERFSVGALFSAEKNPQQNYRFRANGSVGLEFDLVPRQTVNQKNLGLRCAVGPEGQVYDAKNTLGSLRQVLVRQFCDVYLSWHFTAFDVGANLGESAIVDWPRYHVFSATLSLTWRVTEDLLFAPWLSIQQVGRATNAAPPTAPSSGNAKQEVEASMLAAVRQGYTSPFGVQSGLSIRYLFGNASLASEDQRWKNVSNLR